MPVRPTSYSHGPALRYPAVLLQVTIDIQEPEKGSTVVELTQTGIPDADAFGNHDVVGVTEAGWRNQVFGRIRMVFGYGVGL